MGGCQSSAADSKNLTETQETQENETASGKVAEENTSDKEGTKEEEYGNGVFTGLENADEIVRTDCAGGKTKDKDKIDALISVLEGMTLELTNETDEIRHRSD